MTLKIYKPATSPESYSVEEAAQSLRITEKAVLSLIRQGLIMAKPTKNVWEVNRAILESEKYIVSISTDLTTEERVIGAQINKLGDGLFIRPEHLLDKNTDIYVTTLGRRTLAEIKLKKFSGRVLYLVEGKKNEESGEDEVVEGVIIPDGHESTTLDGLPGTLRAIASEIRRGLSKK